MNRSNSHLSANIVPILNEKLQSGAVLKVSCGM